MALPDLTAPYQTPEIKSAQSNYQQAATQSGAYAEAMPSLATKLKDAINNKLNYNQDIIKEQNEAMGNYFAAPAEAREQYQNIWNPFQREALVSRAVANAYAPYATLTDVLGERRGSIADAIQAATGSFQSQVVAAQNKAAEAKAYLDSLLEMANLKAQNLQWGYEQTKPKSTGGGSGINFNIPGVGTGVNTGGGTTTYEEPPMTSLPGRTDIQYEWPGGSGVIWVSDGKGGWN